jgi:hypothetical protein
MPPTGDFDSRLKQAIERGKDRSERQARQEAAQALSEEELRRLHSQYRLQISEHIESCLHRLPNHFPGFRFETIFGERGWGAACSRDDLDFSSGRRATAYSRLEITVRPYNATYRVLDLAAKGTIHNKEAFSRNYYEKLDDAQLSKFLELVDVWSLEYAEMYAARR